MLTSIDLIADHLPEGLSPQEGVQCARVAVDPTVHPLLNGALDDGALITLVGVEQVQSLTGEERERRPKPTFGWTVTEDEAPFRAYRGRTE